MKLLLKNADGESVSVTVNENDTFLDLQRRLSEEYDVDIDIQDFSIEGNQVENHFNVLEYFNTPKDRENNCNKQSKCRLCAEYYNKGELSDIFLVIDKISKCLPLKVEPTDSLSKLICKECTEKLDHFNSFIDSCLSAEKKQSDHKPANKTEPEKSKYCCNNCRKTFKCKTRLEIHVQYHLNVDRCSYCDKKFSSELHLYKHVIYNHLTRKNHSCQLCSKKFRNKSSLKYHLRSHQSLEATKPFKCDICHKSFSRKNILRDHTINFHHDLIGRKLQTCFQCRECCEVFPNTNSGISHMEIHHSDKIDDKNNYSFNTFVIHKLFICQFCDKCYSHMNHLIEHRLNHKGAFKYQCKMCNEEFKELTELRSHLKVHVNDGIADYKLDFHVEFLYACEFCEKIFENFQAFNIHTNRHLNGDNSHRCKFCDSNEELIKRRLSHESSHESSNGLKPYGCLYCDKKFITQSSLVKHVRIHTGEKPFKCKICEKSFSQSSGLNAHFKVHSNDRPYRCETCEKSFKIIGDYKQHVKTHSGLRPFVCDFCKKSFMTRRCYFQHVKIHSDEKLFVCDICNESFRRSHTLKVHKKIHEKG